jgi:hypothetical protein
MKKILCFCFALAFLVSAWAGPADQRVEGILNQYFVIQASLAKDSTQGVNASARKIAELTTSAGTVTPQVHELLVQVGKAAHQIQGKDLKQTREQFSELSKPLLVYLNKFYSGKKEFYRYYCPMAKKAWIQAQKGAHNPYLGSAMPTCGDLIS